MKEIIEVKTGYELRLRKPRVISLKGILSLGTGDWRVISLMKGVLKGRTGDELLKGRLREEQEMSS